VTSLTYDGSNNLIKVTGPFGHTLTFANDVSGRVSQMTVPDGGVYTYAYSSTSNNLVSVTYPSGAQRQYVYENTSYPNALTGIIDENGQRFATWAYDGQGRAISSQHAGGVDLTTLTYNSDGSTSVTDARGNVHGYALTTQLQTKPRSRREPAVDPGGAVGVIACPVQISLSNHDAHCRCWPPHRVDAPSPRCAAVASPSDFCWAWSALVSRSLSRRQ
jgi:YD repeat-containing protein